MIGLLIGILLILNGLYLSFLVSEKRSIGQMISSLLVYNGLIVFTSNAVYNVFLFIYNMIRG